MIQLMLLGAAVLSAALACIVIANNHTRAINKIYFLLSIVAAVWLSVNALIVSGPLTPDDPTPYLYIGRLITPSATMLAYLMMLLVFFFANETAAKSLRRLIYLAIPSIPIIFLSFTNLNVSISQDGSLQLGLLSIPFVLVILTYLSIPLLVLFKLRIKRDEIYRTQAMHLRNAFLVSVVPAVSFGAVLPLFTNSEISNLGPVFSSIFLLYAAWLIVKHKLFDVRPIVAKVIAYALLLATTVLFFGLFTIFATREIIDVNSKFVTEELVTFSLAILIAITLRPTKRFFDRLTNRIFYQDAYDSQVLLDELNRAVVSTVNIDQLLTSIPQTIEKHIKARFSAFIVRGNAHSSEFMVESSQGSLRGLSLGMVKAELRDVPQKVVFVEDLVDKEGLFGIYRELVNNHVGVIARLTIATEKGNRNLGMLILGGKKSGAPYNTQDRKILEIIVDISAIAIQNSLRFKEIENFNLTLQDKIDEATRQLRRKNERLRLLDQTKDDFISMASHQLRTPLTSVKGYTSMVLEGDAGKINLLQRKLLNQAFVSAQRMVYLISDLLNVSRLRTGKFELELVPTNLASVIAGEVEQLNETAKARNLQLSYSKPDQFPVYMLDETKLRQVIMNFIDNAIYYTPSGGKIDVALVEKPESIELTVTDTGIGVPKHDQPHLFTKYFRARNAQVARPDGTGLGLFMAKKVIVAHGGAVVFSSREHQGSTFGFTIAKKRLQAPRAQEGGVKEG